MLKRRYRIKTQEGAIIVQIKDEHREEWSNVIIMTDDLSGSYYDAIFPSTTAAKAWIDQDIKRRAEQPKPPTYEEYPPELRSE